ncbi:MAG TPA: hypothetical protein VGI40_18255 [Pirellulaceae bacterium]
MINNLDNYRWLTSPDAEPWLALEADDPLRLLARLRKDISAERAHLVAEQIDLRRRGCEKFRRADRMFFTKKGLEQATDDQLAAYKATRFPTGALVSDLCCGIGGDLVALCARGPVFGDDRDEMMSLVATANAQVHGFGSDKCSIVAADITTTDIPSGPWHCDPDRRPTGRRATRGELFEPSIDVLDRLLGQNPNAAIKLAPATDVPAAWQEIAELQWLESRGECRQQVAWFGGLAKHPGRRAATIVPSNGQHRTVVGLADEMPPIADKIGRYLYEPAAAILAAKLTSELCRQHNVTGLSPAIAYLTSDTPIDDVALAAFEVLDLLPFDRKQLRAYCRQHNLGRLEIKKRGVELDPAKLRQEIVAPGDNAATILIAPYQHQTRAIIARRLTTKAT